MYSLFSYVHQLGVLGSCPKASDKSELTCRRCVDVGRRRWSRKLRRPDPRRKSIAYWQVLCLQTPVLQKVMGSAQIKQVVLSSSSSPSAEDAAGAISPSCPGIPLVSVGTIGVGSSALGVEIAGGAGMLFAERPFVLDDDDDSEVSKPPLLLDILDGESCLCGGSR